MNDELPIHDLPAAQILKESPRLLPMIYRDCAQPSVQKVGKALETVFAFSNTILLPLKLINAKAQLNFQSKMNKYKEKLESVDIESIIDVPPIVGTPIIDRLMYITDDEIADLFINLLAKASTSLTVNQAHPAFIHMLDRMSVDEARIITHLSEKNAQFIPFINFISRSKTKRSQYHKHTTNLTGLEHEVELIYPENIDTYLDNLSSLQIIESQGNVYKTEETIYKKLEEKYSQLKDEINQSIITTPEFKECEINKGFFEISELGNSFIRSCRK